MYDTIIIGQGPAGYTAGMYCVRRNLKTLVIGKTPGGKMSITWEIENYPGFEKISGMDLGKKMKSQAEKAGCEIIEGKVSKIEKGFKVYSENKIYETKSVIIATGTVQKRLNVEGEEEFLGKGVSYCPTCDGPMFKGKTIAVVGGSNSAVRGADYLAEMCDKVYLIHRKDQFRAEEINVKRVKEDPKIEILFNSEVGKINGSKFVESITLKDGKELKVDGVFVLVGVVPTANLVTELGIKRDDRGFITANKKMETNVKGVFAAGDITGGILQVSEAVGQGAIAATNAYLYVRSLEANKPYFVK